MCCVDPSLCKQLLLSCVCFFLVFAFSHSRGCVGGEEKKAPGKQRHQCSVLFCLWSVNVVVLFVCPRSFAAFVFVLFCVGIMNFVTAINQLGYVCCVSVSHV